MKTGIKVKDAMTTQPISTNPDTTVQDCARLMKEHDVGSVLIEEDNQVIGIVTEFDLTRKVVAEAKDVDTPVKDVMEKVLVTITPDRDLSDAMQVLKTNDVRHLPVVEDDKFTGLVTMKDILRIEPELFDVIVDKIRLREEYRKPISEVTANEGVCEYCGNYAEMLYEVNGSMICDECKRQQAE